jgi:hypothetical protein
MALLIVGASFVASSSAQAEPAWGYFFGPDNVCTFGWLDVNFQATEVPGERGIYLNTNNRKDPADEDTQNLVCRGQVPPDDPDLLPVDFVLWLFGFDGAGVISHEDTGADCSVHGTPTSDWQQVVTPSGRVSLVCKIHP